MKIPHQRWLTAPDLCLILPQIPQTASVAMFSKIYLYNNVKTANWLGPAPQPVEIRISVEPWNFLGIQKLDNKCSASFLKTDHYLNFGVPKKENDTPNQQESILKEWYPFSKRWVDGSVIIRCVVDVCCCCLVAYKLFNGLDQGKNNV